MTLPGVVAIDLYQCDENQRLLFSADGAMARRSVLFVLTCVLMLAQGCSPKPADAAAASNSLSSVVIVRETKHEFRDRTIALYREMQQRCFDSRTLVAQAQGWAYNPTTDAITDEGILSLDTQKTEEYFEGAKYAVVITGTQNDRQNFGVTRELDCKLTSTPFKLVEIRDGACHSINVEYDLPGTTGRRSELKGLYHRDEHARPGDV